MAKDDSKFVNLEQDYELNDWLNRNKYSQTEKNRKNLIRIVNTIKSDLGKLSTQNLTWQELDDWELKNER